MSSYTKQELDEFHNIIMNDPSIKCWTTLEGHKIPINRIKDDHLKNIIKHLEKTIKDAPNEIMKGIRQNSYKKMHKELMRRVTKTTAGKLLYGKK